MVQGVHGGPAAGCVAAVGGVQPFQEGALAALLDFGGESDQGGLLGNGAKTAANASTNGG